MASFTKLDSGRWRALVRKKGSKPLSATFDKKSDAKKWSDEMERKLDSIILTGSSPTPKGTTFADFVDKYIEETDPVKSHGKNKRATLLRLKKEFDGVLMADMSIVTINDFVSKRMKEKSQVGEKISGVTIAVDLSYISTILHWARDVKRYNVDAEIANQVRGALGRRGVSTRSKSREREPTEDELAMIYEAYAKKGKRLLIPMPEIIEFAIGSAMRQGEICAIKIEDVDFDERTVVIRDRKDPKEKIGNDQVVPLLPAAWEIAVRQMGDRKSGRVFQFDGRSVSASFTRICKECDIKDLHFHDLRHKAIGNLFVIGLKIEQVALISGHKDWAMLRRYSHIKAKDVQKAFSELLGKQAEKAMAS